MIDITILKVSHYGEEEARKVLPYIKDCDVFGLEAAHQSETLAAKAEATWESIINGGHDFNWFRKNVHFKSNREDPKAIEYYQKISECMFRNKRLVWHNERYKDSEIPELDALLRQTERLAKISDEKLLHRDVEGFLEVYAELCRVESSHMQKRDSHIALQLTMAEELIRHRYPGLSGTIKYTIFLGALHEPERLIDRVNVVNLSGDVEQEILKIIHCPKSKRDLLISGLYCLMKEDIIEKEDTSKLLAMSFEELVAYVKT